MAHNDPQLQKDINHVREHGYVIIENAFTREEAEAAKREIARLSGHKPKPGRNAFEGLNTNRIYSLLNKTRFFDKFCILPRVLALNDHFLDPGYNISAFHTIQINPGENQQALHYDDGYCQIRRPRPPLGSAILIAFDDFTTENGATVVVPGSHLWDGNRTPRDDEAIPMVCPAGSVVYFISTTWHGGGANVSSSPRLSATVQYCQPYIRPIENQFLAVDPRRLAEIPPQIVEMMGYSIHAPFIGYADGMNPVWGAQRMVKWLEGPLDRNPPAYPKL